MKLILVAVRYQFLGFFKSARVVLTFLFGIVICFLLSGRVMEIIGQYETSIQAAEPFLWTFGDAAALLLVSLLLVFLLSDIPKLNAFTPFYLMRMTKKKWLAAQFLYVTGCTLIYVLFILAATTLLCMKHAFPGNMWSKTAAILGYSGAGKALHVPSTVKVMESISPYGCMVQVLMLMLGYSLTLAFLILLGNLVLDKKYGMLLSIGYSLYGFLLNPNVLGKLLGMEDYDMYRIRSIVGWISPLNHAVYGMHDFGYDNLPAVWQSLGFFGLILFVFLLLSYRALSKYNFSFLGN